MTASRPSCHVQINKAEKTTYAANGMKASLSQYWRNRSLSLPRLHQSMLRQGMFNGFRKVMKTPMEMMIFLNPA
jgi:hypothetical protein